MLAKLKICLKNWIKPNSKHVIKLKGKFQITLKNSVVAEHFKV